MATNFSLIFPTLMSAEEEYFARVNGRMYFSGGPCPLARDLNLALIVAFSCLVSIFGLVGNGAVIWLLGFRMKRNPFNTYILHLVVADSGVLIALPLVYILDCNLREISLFIFIYIVYPSFFHITYSAGQFLLTAISIDRCVCVIFPLWYRCHRPERLSTILCAFIWLLSFLLNVICILLDVSVIFIYGSPVFYAFLMNAMVCLPLITISALILVIRICFQPQLRHQGELLKAVLLSLFFFLTLAFPMNINLLVNGADWNTVLNPYQVMLCGLLCLTLNSFVNPLIYFLVGRQKSGLCTENLNLILQRVFIDEIHGVGLELSTQTQY